MKIFLKQKWLKLFVVAFFFVAAVVLIQYNFRALSGEMSAAISQLVTGEEEDEIKIPNFSDFPVEEEFKGVSAQVDLTSHPQARLYRTVLVEGAAMGPNFAGHYTIISPGCGTECQIVFIFDNLTGKVYSAPFASSEGVRFRINSNLLVFNPLGTIKEVYGDKVPGWLSTMYYKWENNELIELMEMNYWWKR